MELEISSPKQRLSPPEFSDPEEKEISDDDDDDRNHKHRRRETRSQSLERDPLEHVVTRPYRKRNKPFENGHHFGETTSQSSEMWYSYGEKDLSAKFEKRRLGLAPFSRAPLDLSQRIRLNQLLSNEPGPGRGRGSSWNQRDPRFSSGDFASQIPGRGMPNVLNAQNASWSAFGLVPGIPNGGLDTLHSIGLHGTLRPPINPSMNVGISLQRCRDFEERGFCLRGDMCPMEHGVNRIVVEDVQSLSQFNLPVSVPSAHLMGAPSGAVPLPPISAPSSSLMNSRVHSKSSWPGIAEDGLGLNRTSIGSSVAGSADLYDPDQPLWTNKSSETSNSLLALNSSKVDEAEPLLDADPSDDPHVGLRDGWDNDCQFTRAGTGAESQSTTLSVWGRVGSSKNIPKVREKVDGAISSSNFVENETKKDQETLNNAQGTFHQGKGINVVDSGLRTQNNIGRVARKPSQKAQRTLFVNGIPLKSNKSDALFSHFRKFGEIIDIYIPLNSERAFIQFSKREEAEAALRAPDAIMGNRFIKLFWANRDSIPDDVSRDSAPITNHGVAPDSVPPYPSVFNRGNDSLQSAAPKAFIPHATVAPLHASEQPKPVVTPHAPVALMPASEHPKPMVTNGPKPPAPSQKKMESLEFLKEELRKKQEMLDQKRNDFRRQLDKLEKQATGLKGEVAPEQAAKRHKAGTIADVVKAASASSFDPGVAVSSPRAEVMADKTVENVVPQISKTNAMVSLQEPSSLKQSIRPLAPVGAPFIMNRFKLDNRPAAFKILPPLPVGLADVAVLKEHFSTYGNLSSVDLNNLECEEGGDDSMASNISACISFTKRLSAERAFLDGKCWKGHDLQFMWLTSSKSSKDIGGREYPSSSSKGSLDANAQSAGEVSHTEATSGDGESQILERRESGTEHGEADEDFQSSSIAVSSEKQSP